MHRGCSLGALLLTLWSIGLFVDTWQLDAQDPQALVESHCVVASVPSHRFERLACASGERYWLDTPAEAPLVRGAEVIVTTLPVTGTVVRIRPTTP